MDANMKRGMSRLCMLLAVLWMAGMGWHQYGGAKTDENSLTIALDDDTEFRIDSSGIKQTDKNEANMERLAVIFIPALLLLLAVPVGGWIAGGFKPGAKAQ